MESVDHLRPRRIPGQARSRARVDEILMAAHELIGAHGSDGVAMSDIATRSDMSVASLYRYFPSKQAIVRQLAAVELARQREEIMAALAAAEPDRRVQLLEGLRRYIHRHQMDPGAAQLRAAVRADPELAELDLNDSRENARLLAAASGDDVPSNVVSDLERRLMLVFELLDGVIQLVCRIPPVEARVIIDDFISIVDHHVFGRN